MTYAIAALIVAAVFGVGVLVGKWRARDHAYRCARAVGRGIEATRVYCREAPFIDQQTSDRVLEAVRREIDRQLVGVALGFEAPDP